MIHHIDTHQGRSSPEVAPFKQNNVESTLRNIGAEPAPQMIESRLRNTSGPELGSKYGFDLDKRELATRDFTCRSVSFEMSSVVFTAEFKINFPQLDFGSEP